MAEHPIIFSTEMVRAILDGRKTQTRRIIKPQPKFTPPPEGFGRYKKDDYWGWGWRKNKNDWFAGVTKEQLISDKGLLYSNRCPYGKVGDTLWVREAWSFYGTGWSTEKPNQETIHVGYKADNSRRDIVLPYDIEKCELCNGLKTPGQNNPYGDTTDRESYLNWQAEWWKKQKSKSARFMYKWAARIFLEITNIRVERVQNISEADVRAEGVIVRNIGETYWRAFRCLWDSLNIKHGWDKNPWVWVIEFKKQLPERK